MRFTTSSSKWALVRSDLRRFWPLLFGYAVLWLCALPLSLWSRHDYLSSRRPMEAMASVSNYFYNASRASIYVSAFFAVLLAQAGHRVEGVDLTPAMLEEARALAAQRGLDITFREMDAQTLDYEDGCFDAVISRNLTWTLPDPERAYGQWFRVLKPGGVLLNFDADYAANVRSRSTQNRRVPADSPYGHVGMTDRLQRENDEITLTMDVGRTRPAWDREVLEGIGFADCRVDTRVGRRILGPLDLEHAPMFGIAARKP